MFNKKFKDDYPNVRKPLICNGLKEIKPYKNHKQDCVVDIKESEEEEEEPTIEPIIDQASEVIEQ